MLVKVVVDPIDGCCEEDIMLFVQSALTSWGGQRHPDDPLFGSLTVHKVNVGKRAFEFTDDGDVYREIVKKKSDATEVTPPHNKS